MPHKILSKRQLSRDVFTFEVEAALIAAARRPGQFVIVMVDNDYGERIPLTIAAADPDKGTIRLIVQRVGKTTTQLAALEPGQHLACVVGPLGKATHIDNFGTVVCVAGGIGAAPMLPIAHAMKEAANKVITVLGARNKELLILEDEFSLISDELILTTDDGSRGRKALVTEPLEEICSRAVKPDLVVAIGPAIMMKFCCEVTRKFGIHTVVSLNTIMIDGTGMCGGCRVEVDGRAQFVCVDGPEFDGHKVNFDLMIKRLAAYTDHERRALETYKRHQCRIGLDA
ncbi:MAG: sulfide/dihydroorotate dehydrogenase-like FAD/NAD-binding protein [Planctomycetota bacterium]